MTPPAGQPDEPIRVLVVDDHIVVRRGIAAFLDETSDIRVVAEAADGTALAEIQHLKAAGNPGHVVLADLIMPGLDGIETTKLLRTGTPRSSSSS